MKESSKAMARRLRDSNFITRYFVGQGIDIGGAPDPIVMYKELFPLMKHVVTWDLGQGDAMLMDGVPDDHYDFVYSSHCLEHLVDVEKGIKNWFRILKPGGHLIISVPDEDLYEAGEWPSTNNPDHKWTLTIYKESSWCSKSLNFVDLVKTLGPAAQVLKMELIDATYRYDLLRMDQTYTPIAESAIEVVIRKYTEKEIKDGGRLSRDGELDPEIFKLLTGFTITKNPKE